MKRSKIAISTALSAFLVVTLLFSACAGPQAQNPAPSAAADSGSSIPTFPLKEKFSFSYMVSMSPKFAGVVDNFNEMPYYQWLSERLNVNIEFECIDSTVFAEQFNLMLASGKYPDVIGVGSEFYPGGAERAYEEGIIYALDQFIEDGYMPNYKLMTDTFPEYAGYMRTTAGNYVACPNIRGSLTSNGLGLRADLLDKYNLDVPETMDEWDHVLKTFKDNGVEIPICMNVMGQIPWYHMFVGAYGVSTEMFRENDIVIYGSGDSRIRSFVEIMHKWYTEGYIDPEGSTLGANDIRDKLAEGNVGSFVGAGGGQFYTAWSNVLDKDVNTEFRLVGAPYPTLAKGDVAAFGQRMAATNSEGDCITTLCKNPELVAMILDFGYSEEANHTLYYGIEGEHYTIDSDGRIKDWTLNSDGTLEVLFESWKPVRSESAGPFIGGYTDYARAKVYVKTDPAIYVPRPYPSDPLEYAKAIADEARAEAVNLWTAPRPGLLPQLVMSSEDSTRISEIMDPITKYRNESFNEFITGERHLNEFDSYLEQVKRMGIDEAVAIYQQYLDEYNNRL